MQDEGTYIKIPKFRVYSPNFKRHWSKEYSVTPAEKEKGMLTKKQKEFLLLYYLGREELPSLPIRITMVRVAPNMYDKDDNLPMAFKWVKDFLADYFIPGRSAGRADSDPRIKWSYDQRRGAVREYAIELHIDALKQDHIGL